MSSGAVWSLTFYPLIPKHTHTHTHQIPSPKDITDEQLAALLESGDATHYRVPLSLGELHTEKDNGMVVLYIHILRLPFSLQP